MNAQNVQEIDIRALPWFPMDQYRSLPHCSALYFVLGADETVLYIGRTIALQKRWTSHHRLTEYAPQAGVKLAWLFVSDPVLLPALEAACIAFFHPRDNRRRPSSDGPVKKILLRIPDELLEQAKARAVAEDRSLNAQLVQYIRQALSPEEKERPSHEHPRARKS